MRKLLLIFLLIFTSLFLVGCSDIYANISGEYEAYYMTGHYELDDFEYFTIELKENQEIIMKSKLVDGEEMIQVSTYIYRNNSIVVTTKVGFTNLKETFYYENQEIIITDLLLQNYGVYVTIKLSRAN
jgi:predicted nucleic acid-binding protein